MVCANCMEIELVERGEHDWAIARLRHGYVWLNRTQYHEGATFYVAKRCVAELHEPKHRRPDGDLGRGTCPAVTRKNQAPTT